LPIGENVIFGVYFVEVKHVIATGVANMPNIIRGIIA
jgi:hypothetical protein